MSHKVFRCVASLTIALAFSFAGFTPALALPPSNDYFADAMIISTLPFADAPDTAGANIEAGEPTSGCANYAPTLSIWYTLTPLQNEVIAISDTSASFTPVIAVYTGNSLVNLTEVGCQTNFAQLSFEASADVTYYFQISNLYPWESGGLMQLQLDEILPPPNDNFADAKVIASLSYDDSINTQAAGRETGEPKPSCAYDQWNNTAWYIFTPTTSGSLIANIPWANFAPLLAVYTGNSLAGLTEVGCRLGEPLVFQAVAGVTYYFQVGANWGDGGPVGFHLDVTPPPSVGFWYQPFDPTVFDTIQFYDQSYDPAFMGFQSYAWNFGDGATSTDVNPTHRYSADGDYTVQHTVTTSDGRTASGSQVVHVKTHDVAITRLSAPLSATSGQTRAITVQISNKRYGEYVQIDLYKSVPGGLQLVGSYTQFVPVRPANRTTTFTFNYTFTKNDASLGKVTFKAVAIIRDARDALPADNELTSAPPTRVPR
jgi:PKD repeat protein